MQYKRASIISEPNNLNSNLNKTLNPLNLDSIDKSEVDIYENLITERKIIVNIL